MEKAAIDFVPQKDEWQQSLIQMLWHITFWTLRFELFVQIDPSNCVFSWTKCIWNISFTKKTQRNSSSVTTKTSEFMNTLQPDVNRFATNSIVLDEQRWFSPNIDYVQRALLISRFYPLDPMSTVPHVVHCQSKSIMSIIRVCLDEQLSWDICNKYPQIITASLLSQRCPVNEGRNVRVLRIKALFCNRQMMDKAMDAR